MISDKQLKEKEIQLQELIFKIFSNMFPFTQPVMTSECSRLRSKRKYHSPSGRVHDVVEALHYYVGNDNDKINDFLTKKHNCIVFGDPADKCALRLFFSSNISFNNDSGKPFPIIATWFETMLKSQNATTTQNPFWTNGKNTYTTRTVFYEGFEKKFIFSLNDLNAIITTVVSSFTVKNIPSFIEDAGLTDEFR